MSLLVVNSSSKLAQGLVRQLHSTQQFEKIILSDLYQSYGHIKSILDFKESLPANKTKVLDFKFSDKQDLHDLGNQADHLLFVTHDYYMVCPHKIDLLTNTLSLIPFRNYKKLVYVAPAELDHGLETDSTGKWNVAATDARAAHPKLVGLRTDITFGSDSTFVQRLTNYINWGKSIYFQPLGGSPSPVNTLDIQKIVQRFFNENTHDGKSYLAQNNKQVDWNTYVNTIERAIQQSDKAKLNSSVLEKILAPTSNNILTEYLYTPKYRNFTQVINNYRQIQSAGLENAVSLLEGGYSDFEKFYESNQITEFQQKPDFAEKAFY